MSAGQRDHLGRGRGIEDRDALGRKAAGEPTAEHRPAHLPGADKGERSRPDGHISRAGLWPGALLPAPRRPPPACLPRFAGEEEASAPQNHDCAWQGDGSIKRRRLGPPLPRSGGGYGRGLRPPQPRVYARSSVSNIAMSKAARRSCPPRGRIGTPGSNSHRRSAPPLDDRTALGVARSWASLRPGPARVAEHDDVLVAPKIEMARSTMVLVDHLSKRRDFGAPAGGNFQIEGAADMQGLDIGQPGAIRN